MPYVLPVNTGFHIIAPVEEISIWLLAGLMRISFPFRVASWDMGGGKFEINERGR